MKEAGLEEINKYIYRSNNTVSHYISMCPILDLCLDTEGRSGSRVPMRWWDQDGLVFLERQALGEEGGDGDRDGYID